MPRVVLDLSAEPMHGVELCLLTLCSGLLPTMPGSDKATPLIGVSALGDPTDPATWSGTPSNICRQLQALGRLGPAVNTLAYAPERTMELVRRASRVLYRGPHEAPRGRLARYLRSRYAQRIFRRHRTACVLHMGTLDLPLFGRPVGQQHYLFTDGTWHLMCTSSPASGTEPPRLIRDAERLERQSYADCTHIFSISHYVKRDLVEHYGVPPHKVTVVGTGRGGIQPFHGPKDYSKGMVLFVAKCRFEDKGAPLLLQGFRIARQADPRLRLVVVGDPRYEQMLAGEPGVTLLPFVPLDKLQELFNQAMLFAMPAKYEPWGLVYLEALSCRVPVLGLNRNALPEITCGGQYGFCLEDETPEAVAEAMLYAIRHPDELARMGSTGQEHVLRNFTWERTVRAMLDVIDSDK